MFGSLLRLLSWVRSQFAGSHRVWARTSLVGMLAVLALCVASGLLARSAYADGKAGAERELLLLASSAALEVDQYVEGEIRTLAAIAGSPTLRSGRPAEVQAYLDALVASGVATDLVWVDAAGRMLARSGGLQAGNVGLADRDYFQAVSRTEQPAVGQAITARDVLIPLIPVAHPVVDASGATRGMVVSGIRLSEMDRNFRRPALRVIEADGRILYAEGHPDLARAARWMEPAPPAGEPTFVRGPGVLGEPERIVAYAGSPVTGWTLAVDLPEAQVYAGPRSTWHARLAIVSAYALLGTVGSTVFALLMNRSALRQRQLAAQAREARESRDRVLRSLVHDLASPLTVIRAYAVRALRADDEAKVSGALQEIRRESDRAARMLNEIGEVSSGNRVLNSLSQFDLVECLANVVEERRTVDPNHHYLLEVAGCERCEGSWDRDRIERAVENLLTNAAKYSPGGTDVTVSLREMEVAGAPGAELAVQDRGHGIPAAELPRVFEPYFRASNAVAGGYHGSGIGLASVKQVVEQHGGSVEVTSMEHVGTTVTVRLPLVTPAM